MFVTRALRIVPLLAATASARALRPVLIPVVAATAILAAGCGTAQHPAGGPPPAPRLFTEHDRANGTTIHVGVGDKVALVLGSSYWQFAGSSTPAVLRQEGPVTLLKSPHKCLPGVGCQPKRAVFKALSAGKAVITAHRVTCGEALACTGSRGHFKLTVIVG
ncbi:MAG TPA: hypothetical protein VF162_12480 [Streptosporangiaceae bacterium]